MTESGRPPFLQRTCPVLENVALAERTFRVRLQSPDIARLIRPGQFLMLRLPGTTDPLLGRPFALYDTVPDGEGRAVALDVVYLIVGKMTSRLAAVRPGDSIEIWGPLGNGFPDLGPRREVVLVAGGIGQTPFLAYARELLGGRGYGGDPVRRCVNRVTLYYGVRSAALAAGVEDFRAAGADVRLASDDGSIGYHGFVTQLLAERFDAEHAGSPLVGCGPEPMLHALARSAGRWDVPCFLSLETPMACGVGVCFSCVTKVKQPDGEWDYKRVCVEGPVFDAARLALD
jgi:dihydroorotate dehydrogenase electron transfer subunit